MVSHIRQQPAGKAITGSVLRGPRESVGSGFIFIVRIAISWRFQYSLEVEIFLSSAEGERVKVQARDVASHISSVMDGEVSVFEALLFAFQVQEFDPVVTLILLTDQDEFRHTMGAGVMGLSEMKKNGKTLEKGVGYEQSVSQLLAYLQKKNPSKVTKLTPRAPAPRPLPSLLPRVSVHERKPQE